MTTLASEAIQKLKARQERETRRLLDAQQAQVSQLEKLHTLRTNTPTNGGGDSNSTPTTSRLPQPATGPMASHASPAISTSNRVAYAPNNSDEAPVGGGGGDGGGGGGGGGRGRAHSSERRSGMAKNSDEQPLPSAAKLSMSPELLEDTDDVPKVDFVRCLSFCAKRLSARRCYWTSIARCWTVAAYLGSNSMPIEC
jgi:hypothetical protein